MIGLWIGLGIGLAILVVALALIINKADWHLVAHLAKEKILKETLLLQSTTLEEIDSKSSINQK